MSLETFDVTLPRNAFGPRDRARPGDLWRLFQDAALAGSTRRGWPPERYRHQGCAFVVRSMVARHERPTVFGEALVARTWVSSFRRGVLSNRQIRLTTTGGLPVSAATQRWVHVSVPDLRMLRAPPELEAAFPLRTEPDGDVELPPFTPGEGAEHTFTLRSWYLWMDPLAHVNHPAYLDWADESTSRLGAEAGLDPHALLGVAEEVTWTSGVIAPEEVTVHTRTVGTQGDATVFAHRFTGGDGRLCAEATTVRRWDRG